MLPQGNSLADLINGLDLALGFWSRSASTVMAALIAKASSTDSLANTLNTHASSLTSCLPCAPDGTIKRLCFQ